MKMNKENVKKDDGRNLYYFTFEETEVKKETEDFKKQIQDKEE